MTSPPGATRRVTTPFSLRGGGDPSSSRDPQDPSDRARRGCAIANGTRCSSVPLERDDPVACMRSPKTQRCVARPKPKPRACALHEAPNQSPRCRLAANGEHDERCTLTQTGRCALVKPRRSPAGARKRPAASVATRPTWGYSNWPGSGCSGTNKCDCTSCMLSRGYTY
jgi:hypothetical protein